MYVFRGLTSIHPNAVFSSVETASAWIRKRGVSGLLTGYTLDAPGYEEYEQYRAQRESDGKRPAPKWDPEKYCDGSDHHHFYYGLGPNDEGYDEAFERYDAEHAG